MAFTDEITVHKAPLVAGGHGGTRRDWTAAVDVQVTGVDMQSASSNEAERRPEITHTLRAPLLAPVDGGDRVSHTDPRGKRRTYEVLGEPRWFKGPTAFTSHIEADLKAVDI